MFSNTSLPVFLFPFSYVDEQRRVFFMEVITLGTLAQRV